MAFSCTRFAAIVFYSSAIAALSFGDLIVLRHPPEGWYAVTRLLTCYSEDDDSALVWNDNLQDSRGNIADDFQPKKSGLKTNTECAIWNSTECVADWEKSFRWELVNSVKEPMGPILDYRWEGFEEFVFGKEKAELKHLELGDMGKYSGTVVFSVRALRNFDVFLCDEKDVTKARCFWIGIGYSDGIQSKILSCVGGVSNPYEFQADRNCTYVGDAWHETTVIDGYEWRTFRIEWESEERAIKLFKETEVNPFLQGTVKQWHSVSHIFVRSEISSRVRFHFYDYHLTHEKNTTLSTKQFDPRSQDFCIELLVGLCPNCQLKVHLVDESGRHIAENTISGDKNSADSALLSWKPIYLIASLKSPVPNLVRLKIETILDDNEGKGRWAVDSFFPCKSPGSLRKSTIRTQLGTSPALWPEVKCQKLSYSGGAVVDSLSTGTIDYDTSKFLMLVRNSVTSYASLGEAWSVCNPTGCACDRGFTGYDCRTGCAYGRYGYNCNEQCGGCSSGYCDGANGHCPSGCNHNVLLPPLCKDVERPIVEDITDTTARILQKVKPELLEYISNFRFDITSGVGNESAMARTSFVGSTYTVDITELHLGTMYSVRTFVSTNITGKVTEVPSPEISFATSLKRCFEVEPKSNAIVMSLRRDLKGCEMTGSALPGGSYLIEMRKKSTETFYRTFVVPNFPYTYNELEPYTEYKLTVYPAGGKIILWTRTVCTLQSAPEKVHHLRQSHVSDTSVTLQWNAPLRINGIIAKYSVSIKRTTLRACEDLGKQTPVQDDIVAEVNDTMASFGGLNPYAKYTASVIAYTTEPGMEKSIEFQTPERNIPTSSVRNLELIDDQKRLKWDKPEDCLKITGSTKYTRLVFTSLNDSVQNSTLIKKTAYDYLDVYKLYLAPYTLYNVRAYVLRSDTGGVNYTLYQEKNWTTAPSAPSAVKSLDAYDADPDANVISLRWVPPNPANGEIESYHVRIEKGSPWKEWTIKISKGEGACELWENYVCIKNLPIQPNTPSLITVQIYARNKGVEAAGNTSFFHIFPIRDYNKAPGEPSNLTATHEGHGDVIFTWMHPSFSSTKITRFEITVDTLQSVLLENLNTRYPVTVNYTITENRKYYAKMMTLRPSTRYKVSVVAVNGRNRKSGSIETKLSVPTSVGFANETEPQVTFDGKLINVTIPTIVNSTSNTTVKVTVKGLSRCTPIHSQESSPSADPAISVTEWDAEVYQVGPEAPESVKIYTEQNRGVTSICSLDIEEEYTIVFNVTDWYSGISLLTATSPIALSDRTQSPAWWIVLLIIAIGLILVFVWHRRRNKAPLKTSEQNILPLEPRMTSTGVSPAPATMILAIPPPDRTKNRSSIRQSSPDVVPPYNANSSPVKVEEFEEYTKEALSTGLLASQYEMFPKSLAKPCEYGTMPENAPKNRYKDRIPYDETRVMLNKIDGDPHSDYINASYIQGYRKKRGYIATQGPKPKTVVDFWRMVWQENVRVICMLANVVEGGKRKCEQYWPEIGTKVTHGKITISNTSHLVFADYTFRTFRLNCQNETREVTHLHYTGWPDHGVPVYTQSLVAYLKKLLATPAGSGPVVVHCSAGVGRTGTIILCDICLREAVAERIIDVPAVIVRIRQDRPNMIDNAQQYLLAHLAIMESMVVDQTQIPCTNSLPKKIMELKKRLASDIQRLNETVWQDRALRLLESPNYPTTGDVGTSRISSVIPVSPVVARSKLSSKFVSKNNSIDAVTVDGVKMKNQYLASRLPSSSDLSDFWKLIADNNIELIVILQSPDPKDPTSFEIVPGESILVPAPNIRVERKAISDKEEHFTIDKLLLTDTSMEEMILQPVTVITCIGWGQGKRGKPPTPEALVSLWIATEKISRQEGLTLVLCRDGVTGCGLYLALSFLLERISVERECDVISAVRAVRRSRTEFVQSLEEFEYLYDAAVNYVKCFEIYANFS